MTTTSENVQDVAKSVAWLGAEDIAIGGHECAFIHEMNPLYLAYVVQTRAFQDQKDRFVKGTKVKDITTKDLAKILIPVPALEVQNRVAGEIESFDSLVNDISIGLPAELAARRKQYEYYRNKLLTFPEKVA
jgi:type I restriction enzyme S subunit